MRIFSAMASLVPALAVISSLLIHSQDLHGHHRWPFQYKTYGQKPEQVFASEPVIVLIPGLDGCVSFFTDVTPELTREGFHVVMFYLPLAPNPFTKQDEETQYGFDYMVQKLSETLDELGVEEAHIVGESFGGVVAQHFALAHPSSTTSLTLISSLCHTELTPTVQFKANYVLPVVESLGKVLPGAAQRLFAIFHVDDVVEQFEPKWVKDFFVKEASWAHHYSVMQRIKAVIHLSICDRIADIETPSLVVYGQDDNFTKPGSMELLERLPNAQTFSLPGGHLPHLTEPREFANGLLRFLSDVEQASN